MTRNRTGNSKFLKEYNEAGILDLIRMHEPISRSEISKFTGLSPTASGAIVSSLMEKGYVHETGIGESSGGRRPILLELKPCSYFSVGIDIEIDSIMLILADITGNILHEGMSAMPASTPEAAVSAICSAVADVLGKYSVKPDKMVGVGISVPGLVDAASRTIVLAPNLGWENVDIKCMLEASLKISVYVENEAMASAICENWVGACKDTADFVCVNIKSGIGAGIFTGGRPYRGAGGSAGEVGHIVVDEQGPLCGCGNRGCLETFASAGRIVEKAVRLLSQGAASSLAAINAKDGLTFDHVVEAARKGDEFAKGLLNEAAKYIGIALSGIVNTLNPSKIVLGKEFVKYGGMVMDAVRAEVDRRALKRPASNVEIVMSEIGGKTSTLGAAIIPLKAVFGR